MLMDQALKAAQADSVTTQNRPVRVEDLTFEDLAGILQGLDYG
jgi:hypothetical protein